MALSKGDDIHLATLLTLEKRHQTISDPDIFLLKERCVESGKKWTRFVVSLGLLGRVTWNYLQYR